MTEGNDLGLALVIFAVAILPLILLGTLIVFAVKSRMKQKRKPIKVNTVLLVLLVAALAIFFYFRFPQFRIAS